jgi:GntR family transcriptional repressor for pyruvate dehydrogenase complex
MPDKQKKSSQLTNLARPRLPDMVAEQLVSYILESGLEPGDKLPTENALTERLGIGRTSVREGIRQLVATGLLTSRQGYGVTLNQVTIDSIFPSKSNVLLADFLAMSKEEILDLMALRKLIEIDACRLAAKRITVPGIASLSAELEAMNRDLSVPKEFIKHDMRFHGLIAEISGNSIYPKIFNLIGEMFRRQQAVVASLPGAKDRAYVFHGEILSALKSHDSRTAVRVMKEHLNNTSQAIIENL